MSIARRLRRLRESRNWNVADLAERSGVSIASIMYLERTDLTDPTLATLGQLARALDVPVRLLLDDPVYEGAEAITQHLPPDVLQFVADPKNLPYLQLARQLAADAANASPAHAASQAAALSQAAAVLSAVATAQEEANNPRPALPRIVNFETSHKPAQGGR